MIYIIIGHEKNTGNEWVHPQTFDTGAEAKAMCDNFNDESTDTEYRVDSVYEDTDNPPKPFNYRDIILVDPAREEPRVVDFTVEELFPNNSDSDYFNTCSECGSVSLPTFLERHTTWHNKLLP